MIVVSAHASAGTVEQVLELGCSAYVTKPFHTDQLISLVEEHIASESY